MIRLLREFQYILDGNLGSEKGFGALHVRLQCDWSMTRLYVESQRTFTGVSDRGGNSNVEIRELDGLPSRVFGLAGKMASLGLSLWRHHRFRLWSKYSGKYDGLEV